MAKVRTCPFTSKDVLDAFGEEVHFFMHVHVRGYDKKGEGIDMDASFYDKYGAPVYKDDAWMEGYHAIELELAEHFNQCIDTEVDFPLIGGIAGGAHLYQPVGHDVDPWNWTGWVPKKKIWCTIDQFHVNRYFLTLRGNEIQNNLWDYHPFQEQGGQNYDDHYEQITPIDSFENKGYWLKDEPWARYIHIIALKSHVKESDAYLRYNYIVHPLAYRGSVNDIPDNTVDGAQWSILNIKYEKNDPKFNDPTKWGTDVHGLEIFNDFTYFFSWCAKNETINVNNGTVLNLFDKTGRKKYIYWHDTYPLEFGEFLLDTSLERGVYFHAIAANDAYYNRDIVPPYTVDGKVADQIQRKQSCLLSDPKGYMIKDGYCADYQSPENYCRKMRDLLTKAKTRGVSVTKRINFFKSRPYNTDTAFGHTTIVDTEMELRKIMEKGPRTTALDDAEDVVLNWFLKGKFYCHTGVYDIFNYESTTQKIPFVIEKQTDTNELCYEMSDINELIFTFPRVKVNKISLIWRYSLQYFKDDDTIETVHGYFKMDANHPTRLNLSSNYDKTKIKWIMFTAFKNDNPQKRAWFNSVRGLAFGPPKPNDVPSSRTHKIMKTDERKITQPSKIIEVYEKTEMKPFLCKTTDKDEKRKLEFYFDKCSEAEEDNIYVYNMQACPNLPEENANTIHSAKDPETGKFRLPDRIVQNLNGYFRLNSIFPTKLNLTFSWDPETVADQTVNFYCIDAQTGQPCDIPLKPTVNMPEGYEV